MIILSCQVSLKLMQEQRAKKKLLQIKPLLEVVVMSIKAEVMDRKWDTRGSVSLKSADILDHITTGQQSCGCGGLLLLFLFFLLFLCMLYSCYSILCWGTGIPSAFFTLHAHDRVKLSCLV